MGTRQLIDRDRSGSDSGIGRVGERGVPNLS